MGPREGQAFVLAVAAATLITITLLTIYYVASLAPATVQQRTIYHVLKVNPYFTTSLVYSMALEALGSLATNYSRTTLKMGIVDYALGTWGIGQRMAQEVSSELVLVLRGALAMYGVSSLNTSMRILGGFPSIGALALGLGAYANHRATITAAAQLNYSLALLGIHNVRQRIIFNATAWLTNPTRACGIDAPLSKVNKVDILNYDFTKSPGPWAPTKQSFITGKARYVPGIGWVFSSPTSNLLYLGIPLNSLSANAGFSVAISATGNISLLAISPFNSDPTVPSGLYGIKYEKGYTVTVPNNKKLIKGMAQLALVNLTLVYECLDPLAQCIGEAILYVNGSMVWKDDDVTISSLSLINGYYALGPSWLVLVVGGNVTVSSASVVIKNTYLKPTTVAIAVSVNNKAAHRASVYLAKVESVAIAKVVQATACNISSTEIYFVVNMPKVPWGYLITVNYSGVVLLLDANDPSYLAALGYAGALDMPKAPLIGQLAQVVDGGSVVGYVAYAYSPGRPWPMVLVNSLALNASGKLYVAHVNETLIPPKILPRPQVASLDMGWASLFIAAILPNGTYAIALSPLTKAQLADFFVIGGHGLSPSIDSKPLVLTKINQLLIHCGVGRINC